MLTAVGEKESDVPPLPSCPLPFDPQQYTDPPAVSAHVWAAPAAMPTTLDSELTSVAFNTSVKALLTAHCPKPLNPKHATLPLTKRVHVCPLPIVTLVTPVNTGDAGMGSYGQPTIQSTNPSPNWPLSFGPQQNKSPPAPPVACSAQVCDAAPLATTAAHWPEGKGVPDRDGVMECDGVLEGVMEIVTLMVGVMEGVIDGVDDCVVEGVTVRVVVCEDELEGVTVAERV